MPNEKIFEVSDGHGSRINSAIKNGIPHKNWKLKKLLHGGLSGACTYLVSIDDKPYVIKLEKLDMKEIDLPRYCEVIKIASDQLCCPKVYFADAELGVILMDYIDSKPLPLREDEYIKKFAKLIKDLHDGPHFPKWINVFDILDYFYQKLPPEYKEMNIMKACILELEKLRKELSDPADIRPCHADINPSNILFNGETIYLVDWLTASPQNFYFDLAACVIFFYHGNNEHLELFLNEYFGRKPTDSERKKLNRMCQFSSIYYGIGFLNLSAQSNKNYSLIDEKQIEDLPSYSQFMSLVGKGEISLANAVDQKKLGYIFLLMRNNFS
jgi:thiamine kinase-like enzyme